MCLPCFLKHRSECVECPCEQAKKNGEWGGEYKDSTTRRVKGASSMTFLLYLGPVLRLAFMVSSVSLKGLFLSTPALPWVSMVVIKMS